MNEYHSMLQYLNRIKTFGKNDYKVHLEKQHERVMQVYLSSLVKCVEVVNSKTDDNDQESAGEL